MRIKFLEDVTVELAELPSEAWGAVQHFSVSGSPQINPATESFEMPPVQEGYLFPSGVVAELPERIAAGYVAAGNAELNEHECGVISWIEI